MQAIDDEDMPDARSRAEAGDPAGLYYYIAGLVERGRIEEAVRYAHEKHAGGSSPALAYLADGVYNQTGPRPDEAEWLRLKTLDANGKSCESAESAFDIGIRFADEGAGADAQYWLRRSGEQGYQEGWVALGFMLLDDESWRNPLDAIRCFVRCREGEAHPYTSQYPDSVWPLAEDRSWRDLALLADILEMATAEQASAIAQIIDTLPRSKAD